MVEWLSPGGYVEVAVAEESREGLSERELEILRLVVTGVTNREIAARLVISPNTVKVHLRNIFAKLGVESRTEAALVAIQNGWVEVPTPVAEERISVAPQRPPLSWPRRIFLALALGVTLLVALWPRSVGYGQEHSSAFSDHTVGAGTTSGMDAAQRWSVRAALPAPRQRFASVSLAGLVYVIGGDTAKGVVGDVEVYDPSTDRWQQRSAKPTAASNVAAAVLGEEIYVPGGYDSDGRVLSVVEVYRPATDTWRSVRLLPAPRCAYAVAAAGGKLYLFGGWDGSRYVSDVLVYDPEQDAWSYGTPMSQPRGFLAAATFEGRIYLVGGYDGMAESAACEVYDPALEGSGRMPWKALRSMSFPRGGLGLAVAGQRLYAIGGGWNGGLAYNESYDIASDRWHPFPSPIVGQWRTLGVAAVESTLGTTLYALGGWTGDLAAVNRAYRASLRVYLPGLP